MNTGYLVKPTERGYVVEYFAMNSQTFDVQIIETRGPFESRERAQNAERVMRAEHAIRGE